MQEVAGHLEAACAVSAGMWIAVPVQHIADEHKHLHESLVTIDNLYHDHHRHNVPLSLETPVFCSTA
jgi:hypothetical protein